jgi:hypothetical protein
MVVASCQDKKGRGGADPLKRNRNRRFVLRLELDDAPCVISILADQLPLAKLIFSMSIITNEREQPRRRLAYSQAEFAAMIGVSLATAGRMIRSGVVWSVKVNGRRLIPLSEIEKLLTPAA